MDCRKDQRKPEGLPKQHIKSCLKKGIPTENHYKQTSGE